MNDALHQVSLILLTPGPALVYAPVGAGKRPAPVFADNVKPANNTSFRVTKGSDVFAMQLLANEHALTVDYLRDMANGRRAGAYLRVMPRPLGGSVVAMTVPVGPDVAPTQVAAVIDQELAALINLL